MAKAFTAAGLQRPFKIQTRWRRVFAIAPTTGFEMLGRREKATTVFATRQVQPSNLETINRASGEA